MHMTRFFGQPSPSGPYEQLSHRRFCKTNTARGFALIEALIAVLVLSVGLIGMTRLQTRSLQNNGSAYMRTQASLFAAEIISRMQLSASAQNGGALPTSVPDCDAEKEGTLANRLRSNLPNALVQCAIAQRWLTISVRWTDTRWQAESSDPTFLYRMKL